MKRLVTLAGALTWAALAMAQPPAGQTPPGAAESPDSPRDARSEKLERLRERGRQVTTPAAAEGAPGSRPVKEQGQEQGQGQRPSLQPGAPGGVTPPSGGPPSGVRERIRPRVQDAAPAIATPDQPAETQTEETPRGRGRAIRTPATERATPFVPADLPERLQGTPRTGGTVQRSEDSPSAKPDAGERTPRPGRRGTVVTPRPDTGDFPGGRPPVGTPPGGPPDMGGVPGERPTPEATATPRPTRTPRVEKTPERTPAGTPAATPRFTPPVGGPPTGPGGTPPTGRPGSTPPAGIPDTDTDTDRDEKPRTERTPRPGAVTPRPGATPPAGFPGGTPPAGPGGTPPSMTPPTGGTPPSMTPPTGDTPPTGTPASTPPIGIPGTKPPTSGGGKPVITPGTGAPGATPPGGFTPPGGIPPFPGGFKPPKPTPGATPIPTPPSVTPTPPSFKPSPGWKPPVGWRPPSGFKPPSGWTPPGGWNPPPGWNPPSRDWVTRLQKWGWTYVSGRGWVVPPNWTPPSDFVVPPGWYYLPPDAYDDYGFYNPGSVVIRRGQQRRLVTPIEVGRAYAPQIPSEVLEAAPAPPPRVIYQDQQIQTTQVDTTQEVVEVLSRERAPRGERYQGPVLVTDAVQFDFDSYAIRPESFEFLDRIGQALLNPPLDTAIINVEGHTDAKGTDEYNQVLSERRAWAVKSYFVQRHGIDPNRLIIVGYGERAPIATNETEAGRQTNRRVEFENVTDLYQTQVEGAEGAPASAAPNR